MKRYTRQEVNEMLRADMQERSMAAYGSSIGVSAQYVSDVLHNKRLPGPAILKVLRMRAVRSITHVYEQVK